MTGYRSRRCRRPTCRAKFTPASDDLIFCPRCRDWMLRMERQWDNKELDILNRFYSRAFKDRSDWDARIIDENGEEVWALDLAKRYLDQTRPVGR